MTATIEELHERLENARGGGNPGDIEDAIWAIAEAEKAEVTEAAKCVIATAFGNTDGLSLQSQLEAVRMAAEQLKIALGVKTQCYLCDGLGGYAIVGSKQPGQTCPACSGTGFQN
jgi:DnaJ-class molecular chaperone